MVPPLTAWNTAKLRVRSQLTGRERGRQRLSPKQQNDPSGIHGNMYHQESSAEVSQGQIHGSRTPPPPTPFHRQLQPMAQDQGRRIAHAACRPCPCRFLQPERRFLKQRSLKKLESHPKSKRVLKMPGNPETRKGHHRSCAPGHVTPLACPPADWSKVPPLCTSPLPKKWQGPPAERPPDCW